MLPLRILMMLFLIKVVVGSDAKNTSLGTTKNIYLLCVGLDTFKRYHITASLEFSLDLVNNRSDIIPGYILQNICGFSTKYVSFIRFYNARTHARTHARTNARTHERTNARTHERTNARTHTRTHARMHTHTHTHACARMNAHAHTFQSTDSSSVWTGEKRLLLRISYSRLGLQYGSLNDLNNT